MREDSFVEMLEQFRKNLEELYKNASANETYSVEQSQGLLSAAYKELGTASEELQIALEELVIKSEELAATQLHLEAERQHYKNLFEFLPNAYLITNPHGQILQANQFCASLFNIESRFLVNKPLDIFITPSERQTFAAKLSQLSRYRQQQKWTLELQPRHGEWLKASAIVAPTYNNKGDLLTLHWSLQKLGKDNQVQPLSEPEKGNIIQEIPQYVYQQGEVIPLHPDRLWLISQGWVKLTTLTENGEDILIGLVGESMPFGSSLTALPTYQATVVSQKAQLTCVPLTEIYRSPNSLETILPLIIDRLRQTEFLLAIAGVRQVHERVTYLLEWLRRNFSDKVPQGDRLRVRLTHQELANTCGTTRVTITRFLSQLKKQGKIIYDAKHHIIFLN